MILNLVACIWKNNPLAHGALIAQHVYGGYNNNILEGGWIPSTRTFGLQLNQSNGLKSAIYERMVDNKVEFVYATAGTVDWQDWKENAKQSSGKSKLQTP